MFSRPQARTGSGICPSTNRTQNLLACAPVATGPLGRQSQIDTHEGQGRAAHESYRVTARIVLPCLPENIGRRPGRRDCPIKMLESE